MTNMPTDSLPVLRRPAERTFGVLMLDDNEIDRMRLKQLCLRAGLSFRVREAADLDDFRRALDEAPYDMVFLDYDLKMDTGLDALELLKAHPAQGEAIAIMITSTDAPATVVEAMRSGCSDFLVKDELSISMIRRAVTAAIEREIYRAAILREHEARVSVERMLERFSAVCAADIRGMLSGMLRKIRGVTQSVEGHAQISQEVAEAERACMELFEYLENMNGILALEVDPGRERLSR
ncbi:response regulator [Rhodovulum sulfidophilum]|uniref:response regulator n=1 Tax=Rhodovulum sulfidophilum TaxID=35806 RepID=UPI0009D76D8C|nr:response regulator [Rhodovulum sulfidophilum]MBL3553548.1 response regulator [Rhodovulum sulfidophilum]